MPPPVQQTGTEALRFRVVRPSVLAYVRACPGGDISDRLSVDFWYTGNSTAVLI